MSPPELIPPVLQAHARAFFFFFFAFLTLGSGSPWVRWAVPLWVIVPGSLSAGSQVVPRKHLLFTVSTHQ